MKMADENEAIERGRRLFEEVEQKRKELLDLVERVIAQLRAQQPKISNALNEIQRGSEEVKREIAEYEKEVGAFSGYVNKLAGSIVNICNQHKIKDKTLSNIIKINIQEKEGLIRYLEEIQRIIEVATNRYILIQNNPDIIRGLDEGTKSNLAKLIENYINSISILAYHLA